MNELIDTIERLKVNVESSSTLNNIVEFLSYVVENFIESLLSIIACILGKEVDNDTIVKVDREINICIAYLDNLQKIIVSVPPNETDGDQKQYWLRRYNALSILNISEAMERYGTWSNIWQGSNQGEGYVCHTIQ